MSQASTRVRRRWWYAPRSYHFISETARQDDASRHSASNGSIVSIARQPGGGRIAIGEQRSSRFYVGFRKRSDLLRRIVSDHGPRY